MSIIDLECIKIKIVKSKKKKKTLRKNAPKKQVSDYWGAKKEGSRKASINKLQTWIEEHAWIKVFLKILKFPLRIILPSHASFKDILDGFLKAFATVAGTICLAIAWYVQTIISPSIQKKIDRINELREFYDREDQAARSCQMNTFNMGKYAENPYDTIAKLNYLGAITDEALSIARLIDIGQKLHMGESSFLPYYIYDSAAHTRGEHKLLKSYDSVSLYLEDSVIYSYNDISEIDSANKNSNRLKDLSIMRTVNDLQSGINYLKRKVKEKESKESLFLVLYCLGVGLISADKIKKHIIKEKEKSVY